MSGDLKTLNLKQLINPTARQVEFLRAAHKYKFVLYGGAAGGGKSYILRWFLLDFVLKCFLVYGVRNVKVGLFSEDYPTLRDRQLSKIVQEFPPEFGRLVKTEAEGLVFKLKPELGGGMILPRNLDEPSKYNSTEFAAIAVEELTFNPESVFEELRKRLRWPGFPEGFNMPFVAATNPGGIGHAWVKRLWIDRQYEPEMQKFADQFVFIPAKATDNPHNPTDYYTWLQTLKDPQMRRAMAEGDWDLFVGQFFAEWRKRYHVCKPFPIPHFWKQWRGGDWGYNAHTSIGYYAKSPDNIVYKTGEIYVRQKTVKEVAALVKAEDAKRNIRYGVLDPACFNRAQDGGKSIAEQFAECGVEWRKAANDRAHGWSVVREYLAWKENASGELVEAPKFQVFENCTATSEYFPAAVYDAHKLEDLDTDGEDHALDETRYALVSDRGFTEVPESEIPADVLEARIRMERWQQR